RGPEDGRGEEQHGDYEDALLLVAVQAAEQEDEGEVGGGGADDHVRHRTADRLSVDGDDAGGGEEEHDREDGEPGPDRAPAVALLAGLHLGVGVTGRLEADGAEGLARGRDVDDEPE